MMKVIEDFWWAVGLGLVALDAFFWAKAWCTENACYLAFKVLLP